MVHFASAVLVALTAVTVNAAPLNKRIAQVIADSTAKWEAACNKAGGGQECNPVSVAAFSTLLAAAGPCEQQDAGDKMINLAKTLNNDPDMIKFAQIFVQQPRNTPDALSVPYCQKAPKNTELNGLFQCQFEGSSTKNFVGGATVGDKGTIPFGKSAPLSPAGSCPANSGGPIKDGSQLTDITSDPGVGGNGNPAAAAESESSGEGSKSKLGSTPCTSPSGKSQGHKHHNKGKNDNNGTASPSESSTASSGAPIPSLIKLNGPPTATASSSATLSASNPPFIKLNRPSSLPATGPSSSSGGYKRASEGGSSKGFQLQNGKDAQKLNAKFSNLNAKSSCTDGEVACVNKAFAQCVGGKFQTTKCAASIICAALPLVNKPGTSVTCTTESDALARIKATGATGGLTG